MTKISIIWLPLLLLALTVTTVFANERDIEIHFQKRTAVNGDRVVLGDVATIYAKSLKHFEKLASLVIGQMPMDAKDLAVPSEYVRIRVDEALGGTKLSVKINAPDLIEFYKMKVESKSEHLAKEIARQAQEFKKVPAGIELVSEISTSVDLQKLNLDDYRLTPVAENREWRGHVVFRLVSKNGGGDAYWINTRLRWFMNSWIAKTTIPFFKDIDANAFEPGKVEVTQLTELPIAAGEISELERLVKDTRAKRSLRPGMALTASMLDRKPDIKSGQKLKVVFIAESGVRVSTEGVVMSDGAIGDSIKARLKTSRKIVSGKLVAPEVVEVSL